MKIKVITSPTFYHFTTHSADENMTAYVQSIYDTYGATNVLSQQVIAYNSMSDAIMIHTVRVDGNTPQFV